jgi:hypothetical protein
MLVKIGKRKRHDNSISTTRPGTPLASSHTYVAPHHCGFVTRRPWTRFHTHKEKSYCTKIYGAIGIGTRMQQKRSGQLADAVTSVWCATWPRPLAATNRPGQSVRRAPFGLCPPVAARENKAERTVVTVRHITFSHTQAHVILGRLPHIYFGHGCNPASNRLIGQPSLDLIFFSF